VRDREKLTEVQKYDITKIVHLATKVSARPLYENALVYKMSIVRGTLNY